MADYQRTRPSLLLRLRDSRDQRAWSEFDAAYSELIVRYARHRGLQFADAEEVRQSVLLKLSRSFSKWQFDPAKGRFRDFLGQCVRNAISTFFSRHKSTDSPVSIDEVSLPSAGLDAADAIWEAEWLQNHYRRALQTLRATTDARTLGVFEGLVSGGDPPELARRFETSEANVRKIKQRMRERLEETIRRQLADEEPDGQR